MSIEYYDDGCGCRPTVKITDTGSMSTYQKLCYVLDKIQEIIEFVNNFQDELDKKEDSTNITNNRKLSETGDFTGTWFGNTFLSLKLKDGNFTGTWFGDTKTNVDQKILDGQNAYQEVIDLINSNPELNIEFIDGKFFLTQEAIEEIDAGLFTETPTEEIDAGLFIYPCQCKL